MSLVVTAAVHVIGLLAIMCSQFSHPPEQRLRRAEPMVTIYHLPHHPAPAESRKAEPVAIAPRTEAREPAGPLDATVIEPMTATAPLVKITGLADRQAEGDALRAIVDEDAAGDVAKDYRQVLFARLAEHRDYPEAARLRNYQGDGAVSFRIDRGGNLLDAAVERSTGQAMLDRAALRQVRRSAPFPQIPPELPDELVVAMPLQFLILQPGRQMAAR